MNKTLSLLNQEFTSSSELTPQFSAFFKVFKKELTKELQSVNAINIEINRGHFYSYGFFTVNDQAWYFSLSDVRHFPEKKLLYRKVKNYKDFSGQENNFVAIKQDMFKSRV